MTRIGLLSDTHGHFDDRFYELFADVDQIWHAGDIGDWDVLEKMCAFKPVVAVYGNIDPPQMKRKLKERETFFCESVKVYMTHIGGYPGRYAPQEKPIIKSSKPDLYIAGHSHILKVMYDKDLNLLHMNPGACGIYGFHTIRTAIRFTIDGADIKNLEVIELGQKHKLIKNSE